MSALIAKRYAKALIGATQKESDWALIESDLQVLAEAYTYGSRVKPGMTDNPGCALREFFENPVFHPEERLNFVKNLKLSPLTQRCLELLINQHRTVILPELSVAFTQELDTKLGRMRAQVTTARALSPEQLSEITTALFKRLGKEVIPEVRVHPSVLGGVRAQIGGLLFDATLETQFSSLRRDLCN